MGVIDIAKTLRASMLDTLVPQRIVFHHIPKCGGTSVGRALRKRYLLSQGTVKPESSFRAFEAFSGRDDRNQMLIDVNDLRQQMLLYLMFEDVRCVSAHVPFSSKAYQVFRGRYKFVTVLRDPVKRFVSHYYWSTNKPHAHGRIEEDFAAFLDTDRAKRLGATYVEYLCGLPISVPTDSPQAIAAAVANLNLFDVVGDIAESEGISRAFRQAIGVRLHIGHENKRRKSTRQHPDPLADPILRQRVEALCAPDLAVWNAYKSTRRGTK